MAIINLLPKGTGPDKPKRQKGKPKKGVKFNIPLPKLSFSSLIPAMIIIALCGGVLLFLLIQFNIERKTLASLRAQVDDLQSDHRELNTLRNKKAELVDIITFYVSVTQHDVVWSEKLRLIRQLIPSEVWLNSISTDGGFRGRRRREALKRGLSIRGSAVSTTEPQIIESIMRFVTDLKEDASFNKDFEAFAVGPLRLKVSGEYNVADFSLNCRFR